jgi:hypothetical protein
VNNLKGPAPRKMRRHVNYTTSQLPTTHVANLKGPARKWGAADKGVGDVFRTIFAIISFSSSDS